ncbi:hypothetical protein PABG_12475 [Paracoccidioides brasiliensis Pb03]|nr:hypothetical protein PABG_12475 [Paracoccidioides brasiliensis Pb03]
MSSRTQAAGPLDTPASNNMNRDEHEYNTSIPEPRGETSQRDEININEKYMERQDRQIKKLIQRLEKNSDFLSNTTKNFIKDKVDEFHKDVKIKLKEMHTVILTEVNYLK